MSASTVAGRRSQYSTATGSSATGSAEVTTPPQDSINAGKDAEKASRTSPGPGTPERTISLPVKAHTTVGRLVTVTSSIPPADSIAT